MMMTIMTIYDGDDDDMMVRMMVMVMIMIMMSCFINPILTSSK